MRGQLHIYTHVIFHISILFWEFPHHSLITILRSDASLSMSLLRSGMIKQRLQRGAAIMVGSTVLGAGIQSRIHMQRHGFIDPIEDMKNGIATWYENGTSERINDEFNWWWFSGMLFGVGSAVHPGFGPAVVSLGLGLCKFNQWSRERYCLHPTSMLFYGHCNECGKCMTYTCYTLEEQRSMVPGFE